MFVFWNPCARANLHQQKRGLKLCSATLKYPSHQYNRLKPSSAIGVDVSDQQTIAYTTLMKGSVWHYKVFFYMIDSWFMYEQSFVLVRLITRGCITHEETLHLLHILLCFQFLLHKRQLTCFKFSKTRVITLINTYLLKLYWKVIRISSKKPKVGILILFKTGDFKVC